MAMTLLLLEGGFLFATVCAVALLRERPFPTAWGDAAGVVGQALAVSLCCIAASSWNGLYDLRMVRRFAQFASRLAQSFGLALIMLVAFYTLFPEAGITDAPFTPSLLIIGLLLPLRAVSLGVMRSRSRTERVLILGRSPLAQQLIAEIESRPRCRYVIAGVLDDGLGSETPPHRYPVLGPLEHLGKILEEVRPDRIIVALAERRGRLPVRRLLEARLGGIIVEDAVEVYERLAGKLAIESLTPSSLLFSREFWKPRLAPALGRGVSLVASIVGLVCLAPLLGLIALAIKLDSPGPVLFVQDRVGMGGKPFKLLKFRTMHPVNRETSQWVRDNGHRITRAGRWLRKFRLDELPQFVNILRGDMNLVGPRPHPTTNFELLVMVARNVPPCGEQVPYYALRSMVRPGLTGWAQVRYRYANDLDEEIEKIRYDLHYIKHLSSWLDLRILFETIKVILSAPESPRPEASRIEARLAGKSALALPKTNGSNGSEAARVTSWTVVK